MNSRELLQTAEKELLPIFSILTLRSSKFLKKSWTLFGIIVSEFIILRALVVMDTMI